MGKTLWAQTFRPIAWITVVTLLVVCLGLPGKASEEDGLDVPLGHWSYAAVESLSQTPLIAKSDVLFDSHTSISRYEMALLVAKILRRLDDLGGLGENGLREGLTAGSEEEVLDDLFKVVRSSYLGKGALTNEHLSLIKRLVGGFNSELTSLGLIKQAPNPMELDLVFDPSSFRLDRVDQVAKGQDDDDNEDPFRLSGWRTVFSSDSTVWKSNGWELEAGVSQLLGEAYDPFASTSESARSVTSLEGRLQVSPTVRVSGGYSANPNSEPDAGRDRSAARVGAQMTMGEVEVGATYKSISSQFDPLISTGSEGKDITGYDVSVHYKDVTLSTGKETQRALAGTETEPETITSVGLKYGLGDEITLRADYRYVDIDQLEEGDPSSTRRTTVGLGVSAPSGSLNLGVTYEQDQGKGRMSPTGASADIAHAAPWDSESVLQAGLSREDLADSRTTSLSLGYNYRKEAALVFGYKMIDFTDAEGSIDDYQENIATAELSIKF